MPFVKIDCAMLTSSIWFDKDARDVFVTALLMAEPREFVAPIAQIKTRSLEPSGWEAPPGWYGFVPAAGMGILRTADVEVERGYDALERLGSLDLDSRSNDFEGRRMIRIDGGYLVLNFVEYRDRDYTGKDRSRRWRERQRAKRNGTTRHTVGDTRDDAAGDTESRHDRRDNTQAEAYLKSKPLSSDVRRPETKPAVQVKKQFAADSVEAELSALLLSLIRERNPNHRAPNLQKWAAHVDLMIRIDHRDPEEIRRLIEWSQGDVPNSKTGFCWANNILSTAALREHFDQLVLKSAETARPRLVNRDHEECIGRSTA
jgi:hypothetical protein